MASITTDKKTQVLIVSLSDRVRRSLSEGLTAYGYGCTTAPDADGAMTLLKKSKVDVVVSSIELVGMNGLQLSRAVSRIYPHVPIVIMSQQPDGSQVAQALSNGAADMASESSTAEDIHAVIERNLERKSAAARRIVSDRAEILFKAIRSLTAAIDAKSHYAARHSSRVTQLSLMVGARLGLSQQEMMTLELAAQLHDVGKIGTPDSVLQKPDTLTDDEWVDVLKHPALGGAFLACVPELCEIASVVRHHHEHFDGTGYPDGLQGDAIPLFSRIITVADAYDAMTSERPYRPAMAHDAAAEELERHGGTQFDPAMVNHLLVGLNERSMERKAA